MKKEIIYGCEARGDADKPYLTRITLFECKRFQICLHIFHRSDADDYHDHPWNFLSIILWRGYYEETFKNMIYLCEEKKALYTGIKRKRIWPGMILYRKARHSHRVVLKDHRKAVTLVVMGKRQKEWGFFTNSGWQVWKKYFKEKGC